MYETRSTVDDSFERARYSVAKGEIFCGLSKFFSNICFDITYYDIQLPM